MWGGRRGDGGRKEGRKEGRTRGWCGGGTAPTNKNARFLSAAQTELECGGWTKWGGVLEATCDLINKPVQGIILRQELRVTTPQSRFLRDRSGRIARENSAMAGLNVSGEI